MAGFSGLGYGLAATVPGMLQAQTLEDAHTLSELRARAQQQKIVQDAQAFPAELDALKARTGYTRALAGRAGTGGAGGAGGAGYSPAAAALGLTSVPGTPLPPNAEGSVTPQDLAIWSTAPPQSPGPGVQSMPATPPGGLQGIIAATQQAPSATSAGAPGVPPTAQPVAGPGTQPPPGPAQPVSDAQEAWRNLLTDPHYQRMNTRQQAGERAALRAAIGPQPKMQAQDPQAEESAQSIAQGIMSGRIPPDSKGLSRGGMWARVLPILEKGGYNVARAQQEWKQVDRTIASLNAPRMQQFKSLSGTVFKEGDRVKTLAAQMNMTGSKFINMADLWEASNIEGDSPRKALAQTYLTAINNFKENFAQLANGGYAPTESVWHLANAQLNPAFSVKQMNATIDEMGRAIKFRLENIPRFETLGPGAPSRYAPESGRAAPAGGQPSGPTATGPDGKKMMWDGKAWVDVPGPRSEIPSSAARFSEVAPQGGGGGSRLAMADDPLARGRPMFEAGGKGGGATGGRPVPVRSAEPETVRFPAVKDSEGKIHEGAIHSDAIDAAIASGAKMHPQRGWYGSTGFVTSKGRFVSREEAIELARKAGQTEKASSMTRAGSAGGL